MYSVYLSLAIAFVVGAGWKLLEFPGGWFMVILMALVAFMVSWIIIVRRLGKKLQPTMVKMQKLAESGQLLPAIQAAESLLPVANWAPMLKGQLYAQMGILSLAAKKEDQAIQYLEKATPRAADGKLFLACYYYRKNKMDEARRVLDAAMKVNRKDEVLHNVYAWLLIKHKDREGAIQKLNALLAKVPGSQDSKDNLLRLQNHKRLNMKPFGMRWYSLGLERAPASMAPQQPPQPGHHHGRGGKQRQQWR